MPDDVWEEVKSYADVLCVRVGDEWKCYLYTEPMFTPIEPKGTTIKTPSGEKKKIMEEESFKINLNREAETVKVRSITIYGCHATHVDSDRLKVIPGDDHILTTKTVNSLLYIYCRKAIKGVA